MNPALTGYDRRACYVTFDVTREIHRGDNAVGVVLGNGRYFAPRRRVPVPMNTYGFPKLLLQLRLEYADGSVEQRGERRRLAVDRRDGPIRANNEFDGEEYDARREMPGWSLPVSTIPAGSSAADRQAARRSARSADDRADPRDPRCSSRSHITNPRPGIFMVDFGQAFYGSVRLTVSGPGGDARSASARRSTCTPDGMLNVANDRSAE